MRIEKVGGNRKGATKLMKKKLREMSKHFGSLPEEQSNLGTFLVSSPEGDSETGLGVASF
ncbi:hypothetical protein E2C01_027658 [Portunus trituberculatus]|uniref:Uncharacterized protein n=1 Tax=Portunus trituberculatus TaxID=210409 RepID=A0A5B7EPF6_PORTR|nr:hypothetical protein [Portunus trituberculatus]